MADASHRKASAASPLSIDRAALILLRVKRVFRKKKLQRKEKNAPAASTLAASTHAASAPGPGTRPPPLLRSRTLPAIVVPGISILQAQLDCEDAKGRTLNRLQAPAFTSPKIVFADDSQLNRHLRVHRLSSPGPTTTTTSDCSSASAPPRSTASSTALHRIVKLLNQRLDTSTSPDAGRRLSWERREPSGLARSSSIDSVVEPVPVAGAAAGPGLRRAPSPQRLKGERAQQ
ncbi:L-aspartate oxidase, partial [Frankliniella fusca]